MEDRLPGGRPARARRLVFAGVQVAVEAGEVAGGDIEAEAMAPEEHVARRPEVDGELRHASRGQRRGSP